MSFTDRLLLWLHVGFAIFTLGPVAAAMMATPRYIRTRDLAVLRYLRRTTGIFGALSVGVFLFGLLLGRSDFNKAWFSAAMTLFVVSAALLVLVFRDQRRAINAIAKAMAVGGSTPARPSGPTAAPGSAPHAGIPDGPEAHQDDPDRGAGGEAAAPGRPYPADKTSSSAAAQPPTAAADKPSSAAADKPSSAAADQASSAEDKPSTAPSQASAAADKPRSTAATISSQVASVEKGRIASLAGVISVIWLVILVLMVWHG